MIALALLVRLVLFVRCCLHDPCDPDGNGPRTLRPEQLRRCRSSS